MLSSQRRTQTERNEATRSALLRAARAEFVEMGYQEASTARMVQKAEVTRGALYHHFPSKIDVFDAVIEAESKAVANDIRKVDDASSTPIDSLLAGVDAYFDAMRKRGRTKLLLLEAPTVLGQKRLRQIERLNDGATLAEGLSQAIDRPVDADLSTTADLLSGVLERGALLVANQGNSEVIRRQTKSLLLSVLEGLQ